MLFHEILQIRELRVGSLAYFHFGTEQEMGGGVVSSKKSPVNCLKTNACSLLKHLVATFGSHVQPSSLAARDAVEVQTNWKTRGFHARQRLRQNDCRNCLPLSSGH